MTDKISSIQIIGTQRSGSNLLRLILNQYDEISAPHPPHVLKTFASLLPYYNDLKVEENFNLLANDITDFVNANPVPWNVNQIQAKELIRRSRNQSLLGLYETLYVIKAEQDNAVIWCCKSMFNEYYAREIEDEGIRPFYIYLYRDGRDVAASFKRAIIGHKHIYHIASKWLKDQERALLVKEYVGDARFCMIKYEELISNPEKVLKSLSTKLRLPYSPKLLDYYESSESQRTASSGEMWKNVAKPIISDNTGKYRTELSDDEILMFENIAGKMVVKLGYPLNYTQESQKTYNDREVVKFDKLNAQWQEEARKNASEHDLVVRSKQEEVLFNIKKRFSITVA
ncbi:MAG: sulfotransferase [Bacteroidota bacterium]